MKNTLYQYTFIFFTYIPLYLLFLLTGCSTSYYIKEGFEKAAAETDDSMIDYRILLIGDAGEPSPDNREPVLHEMENRAKLLPERTINIFLGDNIYPFGLESEEDLFYDITRSRLDEQINIMKNSGTEGIFIPGNHDWGEGSLDGWDRIMRMGKYIDASSDLVEILPKDGCPGPVIRDFGSKLRVIILDSQWWLHNEFKPDSSNSSCFPVTKEAILNLLDAEIASASAENKFVLITAHHPLDTYGTHGGYFDWKAHIFPLLDFSRYLWIPLPVIGSFYPLARMAGISPQDMSNSRYKNYIKGIKSVISKYDNIIYAAGHEHSLQIIEGVNNNIYLVSGYGTAIHANTLSYGDKSIFSVLYPGFIQLDVLKDNRIRLAVFILNNDGICEEAFSTVFVKK